MVFFEIDGKFHRICNGAARVGGHQVRNQILFLADFLAFLIETLAEAVEVLNVRFAHLVQNMVDTVLRCNLELSADVVFYQLLHKGRVWISDCIIVADARTDKHFLDSLDLAQFAQQVDIFAVVDVHVRTWFWSQTLAVLAQAVFQLLFAGRIAEVCGWAAYIMDISLESRIAGHFLCFCDDGFLAAGNDLSALMEGDGAEVAVAKAAAVLHDGKFDLLDGIYTAELFIGAGERELENFVQLFTGEGRHRRILYQIFGVSLLLDNNLAVDSILPLVLDLMCFGIAFLVFRNLAERSTGNAFSRDLILSAEIACSADVADGMDIFALLQLFGQLFDDLFAHTI